MTTKKGLLLSGAATIALAMLPVAASAETLTISWWGFNGDKLNEFIVQPFQEQCGCEIVFETGNSADRLGKVQGGKGRVHRIGQDHIAQ